MRVLGCGRLMCGRPLGAMGALAARWVRMARATFAALLRLSWDACVPKARRLLAVGLALCGIYGSSFPAGPGRGWTFRPPFEKEHRGFERGGHRQGEGLDGVGRYPDVQIFSNEARVHVTQKAMIRSFRKNKFIYAIMTHETSITTQS